MIGHDFDAGPRASASCCSCRRRRAASDRARAATRCATPCSQLASESFTQSDRALLASTRKVAWKASSAACSSRSTPRQTRKTIGPCRSTRASKASSAHVLMPVGEPRQQLRVGQPGEGAQVPQPMNLPAQPGPSARHVRSLVLRGLVRFPCNALKRGSPRGLGKCYEIMGQGERITHTGIR